MKKNLVSEVLRALVNGEDPPTWFEIPRHFYKYKYIDEDHPEYSSRIFTHNELHFCSVNKFNDPFDCQFQVDVSGSKKEAIRYRQSLLKKFNPSLNRNKRRSTAREDLEAASGTDFANKIRDGMRHSIEKWGICCLSEVPDNILMWSHYANAHEGFCLQFSRELGIVLEEFPRRVVPLPVGYSETYPVAKPIHDRDKVVGETILTKAKQWEYEKEWRMIYLDGPGLYHFEPQSLTGVILGCRMSEKHKEMIREWCRNREPALKYYEARESEENYSLNIVETL